MIKHTFACLGLGLVLATAAVAQSTPPSAPAPFATPAPTTPTATPANPDDCLKAAFDLAQTAEAKKLADDKLDKIEELLTKMESHCDARQFTEAMAVATDIRTMIEAK